MSSSAIAVRTGTFDALALREQRSRGQVDRRSCDRGADPPRTTSLQPELVECFVQLDGHRRCGDSQRLGQRIAGGDRHLLEIPRADA